MKFVAISDTHNQHAQLNLPAGDVLIHAGDVSGRGRETEVKNFLDWFSSQPFTYKVFIAGNHDFFFEKENPEKIKKLVPDNVIYLNDSGVAIEGINIWGSPIQPWFYDWAFNRHRGADIRQHWQLIPGDTHILVTHGPPYGILDRIVSGTPVGCEELAKFVQEIGPRFHIFGHIHEGYGKEEHKGTTFINASVLDERYRQVNAPVVFEV